MTPTAANIHTIPTGSIGEVIGIQNVVAVASPIAGSEWTYTFPGGFYYRLLSGTAQFVTSATVANRGGGVKITTSDGVVFQGSAVAAVPASSTAIYSYNAINFTGGFLTAKGAVCVPSPTYWLQGNWVISSTTANIDAADQYSKVVLLFEQFDFGALGQPMVSHLPTQNEIEQVYPGGYR